MSDPQQVQQPTISQIRFQRTIDTLKAQRNQSMDICAEQEGLLADQQARIQQLEAANKELAEKAALDAAEIEKLKELIKNPPGKQKAA